MKKILKKIFSIFPKTTPFTAQTIWNQSRFSEKIEDLNIIANKYIKELCSDIENVSRTTESTCIVKHIASKNEDVFGLVIKFFEDRGFICLLKSYKEMGDENKFIIISWENGGNKSTN